MLIWFAACIPNDSFGGVNRSMIELSSGLRNLGHTCHIKYAAKPDENYLLFSLKLGLHLLFSFQRPDWIIARSTDGFFCSIISKLFRLKTRIALHSHGWEEKVYRIEKRLPSSLIKYPTTFKSKLLRFPLLNLTLKYSSVCICGTIEETRWIRDKHKLYKDKIKLISNGASPSSKAFWTEQNDLPPSFLLVGGFTWKKNLEYGIDCFRSILKHNPDARLFLVGTENIPEDKEDLLKELGDSLFLVERESPEKMDRWYETCPFLLSTSRYEGGRSLTILEAQSKGIVVFSSSVPSSMEIVKDNKTGVLLTGCDLHTDSEIIINTCNNHDLCGQISRNAWKSSLRRRWNRQAKRLEKLLSS